MVRRLQYLTQAEAARAVGRDESTISTYVKAGRRSVGKLSTITVAELIDRSLENCTCDQDEQVKVLIETLRRSFGDIALVELGELHHYIGSIRVGRPRKK